MIRLLLKRFDNGVKDRVRVDVHVGTAAQGYDKIATIHTVKGGWALLSGVLQAASERMPDVLRIETK